jgi:epoxyqueuosine reductase
MDIAVELKEMLKANGVFDTGFAKVDDAPGGLPFVMSIVIPLSGAVIDEIDGAPTQSYYHHYRTVNAFIDRTLLMAGLLLQREGYQYLPVAASQTINNDNVRTHCGLYSHKKAAVLAGLGTVGKNSLLIHPVFGPRVRLGTLFTDCPLASGCATATSPCGDCDECVCACPAHAIKGTHWRQGIEPSEMFDADACNSYMRQHFMKIGRGAVCGICMKVCSQANKS